MNFKRFIVFVCVCVCVVSLGLTTYYFLRDEERIIAESTVLYLNTGEDFEISYEHINPRFGTEINITIQDEHVVEKNPITGFYTAINGGKTIITISSNKKSFRGATIEVNVGDGSFITPFYIRNSADLLNIGNSSLMGLDKNYILTSNLSLDNTIWMPISNSSNTGFLGTFDFNFKTISNLKLEGSHENCGLFAKIGNTGTVKNLILKDVDITVNSTNTGAIAGICEGTIERCAVVSGSVVNTKTSNANVGALIGALKSMSNNYAVVNRSYAVCSVEGSSNVGGLIGLNDGGKLVDSFSGTNFELEPNSINATSNSANIGGLIGFNRYSSVVNNLQSIVLNCYSSVKINGSASNEGALIGINLDENFDAGKLNYLFGLYFARQTSGISKGASNIENGYNLNRQLVALSSADLFATKSTFDSYQTRDNVVTSWDFINVWTRDSAVFEGYPHLNMTGASIIDVLSDVKIGNQIWNINDLNELHSSSEKWMLMVDLDLSTIDNFTPIGTVDAPFNGVLDGNNHKIYNLTTATSTNYMSGENQKPNEYYGLFAVIGQKGSVLNLQLENINISTGVYVGALAGMNLGVVQNCKVVGNDNNISNLSSSNLTGGLVGMNANTIQSCEVNYSNITGSTVKNKNLLLGGIAGQNTTNGNITNCKVKSKTSILNETIDIVLRAGGIVGENSNLISKCAFAGNITSVTTTSELTVGGIAGANYDDGTRTEYSSAQETTLEYRQGQECEIEFCISSGTITGYRAGGLVGYNLGDIKQSQSNSTIKGVEVGGLICTMDQGTIMDCYSNCTLQGENAKSEKAGLVHFAYSYQLKFAQKSTLASCVLNCFSSSNFDDTGVSYRETATSLYAIDLDNSGIQFTDGYWINNLNDSDVASNAKMAKRSFFAKKIEKQLTTAECNGTVETFIAFFESGFRGSVWNFVVGSYPTLKNVATI